MFDRTKPYNNLPPLPPKARLETEAVLKAAITASRNLAELKGRANSLPNPAILLNTIALQEAKASSEIENIFTTNDELYRGLSMDSLGLSPHTKEVLHYNEALWHGTQALRQRPLLTTNLFIEIANIVKESGAVLRQQAGTKIVNPDTREVLYTPPEGEDLIRGLLGNLEVFANLQDDGLDPLVKLGVLHYQFEAIHPFYDGNGRTGRILLILYLVCAQLLDQPILFLSRYIIARKSLYYRRLRAVTEEGAWEDWLLYVIRAIDVTAGITARKIKAIADLLGEMVEEARERLNKRNFPKEIIEQFFVRPYCKIRHLESAGHGSRATASGYLHALEKAGLVRKIRAGKEILFLNHRLLELLAKWEPVEAE